MGAWLTFKFDLQLNPSSLDRSEMVRWAQSIAEFENLQESHIFYQTEVTVSGHSCMLTVLEAFLVSQYGTFSQYYKHDVTISLRMEDLVDVERGSAFTHSENPMCFPECGTSYICI